MVAPGTTKVTRDKMETIMGIEVIHVSRRLHWDGLLLTMIKRPATKRLVKLNANMLPSTVKATPNVPRAANDPNNVNGM